MTHPAFRERVGRVMFEKWVASLPVALRWEDQSEEWREAWRSLGDEFKTLDALPNWYKEAHGV